MTQDTQHTEIRNDLPRQCEVAVVGAGPAGTCAAFALAEKGIDVVLLERERLPRYKVCGGGVVYRARAMFPADAGPVIERDCHTAELNLSPGNHHYTASRDNPIVSMAMRDSLDMLLARAARDAGAKIIAPCRVISLHSDQHGVDLATNQGTLCARFAVAADGAAGKLARMAGFDDGRNMAPALEHEIEVPDDNLDQFSHTARFDLGAIPGGYGWVFPKRNHLSVGVGVLAINRGRSHALKGALGAYLSAIGAGPVVSARQHGYVIPVTPRSGPLVKNHVVLTGDAAGTADPVTGEGISNAALSGYQAADAIVTGGFRDDAVLARYQSLMEKRILGDLRMSRRLAGILYGSPAIASAAFGRYGQRITERVTDIFMGSRSYTDISRRSAVFRLVSRMASA